VPKAQIGVEHLVSGRLCKFFCGGTENYIRRLERCSMIQRRNRMPAYMGHHPPAINGGRICHRQEPYALQYSVSSTVPDSISLGLGRDPQRSTRRLIPFCSAEDGLASYGEVGEAVGGQHNKKRHASSPNWETVHGPRVPPRMKGDSRCQSAAINSYYGPSKQEISGSETF
jgi:hypothetical protein